MSVASSIPSILVGALIPPSETTEEAAERLFRGKMLLAPMVRANTLPLRLLALEYGADTVYTEELVDRKWADGRIRRVENERLGTIDFVEDVPMSRKQRNRLGVVAEEGCAAPTMQKVVLRVSPAHERGRLIFQIGTNCAARALKAAQVVIGDVAGVDLNMGCPKKFSVHGGMGAGLLKTPEVAKDVIRTLKNGLPAGKTVTCKIRLPAGGDVRANADFCRAMESAGADAVAVHLRGAGERNGDRARWEQARDLSASITVPFIANGDVLAGPHVGRLRAMVRGDAPEGGSTPDPSAPSPVSLMIARGALRNCSIFRAAGPGGSDAMVPLDDVVRRYLRLSILAEPPWVNPKYVVMQMLRWNGTLKTPLGKHVRSSRSFAQLAAPFNVDCAGSVYGTDASSSDKAGCAAGSAAVAAHAYSDEYFSRGDAETERVVAGLAADAEDANATLVGDAALQLAARVADRKARSDAKRARRAREKASTGARPRPPKQRKLGSFLCECGVRCATAAQLKIHRGGRKHSRSMEAIEARRKRAADAKETNEARGVQEEGSKPKY
jgi:tRNA-dihydrouridine synthase 2